VAALPVDSPAPHFELPDLAGDRKTVADFLGQPVLMIFFDPACGFCWRSVEAVIVGFGLVLVLVTWVPLGS